MVIGAVIAFFLSPFVVHSLGKELYGIWAIVFSVITYMNFLDMGMKQALARYISHHYATEDYTNLNKVISTSTFIYSITGVLVIAGTLIVAYFFLGAFNLTPEHFPLMRKTLIIIGLNLAVNFFMTSGTAIGPFHRYDISNVIEVIISILQTVFIVLALMAGYGIIALAWITIILNVIRNIIRRYAQQKLVPQIHIHFKYITKEYSRILLSYGFISFLIVMATIFIFNTGNIIIGIYLTTTAVTFYSIPIQIINYLRAIINAVGIPLVPAISHLDATSSNEDISALYLKICSYLYFLTAVICTGLMFFGGKFIYLWMGPDFTDSVKVLYIISIPIAIYLPQVMANSVLLGIGKHKTLFYVLGSEAVLNLVLSIILVQHWGIIGVAWGLAIPQLIIYIFIYPYVFHRIIKANVWKFYSVAAKMITLGALFTVPPSLLMFYFNTIPGWLGFIADAGIVGMISMIGFWKMALDSDTRNRLEAKILRKKPDASADG